MKLKILLVSLLSAAASAKGVYVEGATADSSGVEAVVAAAKLGGNEAPAANLRRMDQTLGECGPACHAHRAAAKAKAVAIDAAKAAGVAALEAAKNSVAESIGAAGGGGMESSGAGITLTTGANGANGCGAGKCDVCQGDCDSDADCKSGLRCFQRNGLTPVPGCSGDGAAFFDYCVKMG